MLPCKCRPGWHTGRSGSASNSIRQRPAQSLPSRPHPRLSFPPTLAASDATTFSAPSQTETGTDGGCEPSSIRSIGSSYSNGWRDGPRRDGRSAVHRRQFLLGLAYTAGGVAAWGVPAPALAAAAASPPPPASPASFLQPLLPSPAPDLIAQLEGRAPIFQPGVAWALRNRDRQLFYPSWLLGEWEVTARFAAASFPQGRRLLGRTVPGVLKGSMVVVLPDVGAAMEGVVSYRARFVESAGEGGGVVADRVFNVQQLMDAFYGFEVTRRVEYEPLKNPTRMTVVYATPRQDKSVISEDLRKAEMIINNRISQRISPTDFICGELFRQISQASAQGAVGDYEAISRYTLVQPGDGTRSEAAAAAAAAGGGGVADPAAAAASAAAAAAAPDLGGGGGAVRDAAAGVGAQVRVLQRVAAFLQPQDAAFFESGNQAVAAYDYTYDMRRVS